MGGFIYVVNIIGFLAVMIADRLVRMNSDGAGWMIAARMLRAVRLGILRGRCREMTGESWTDAMKQTDRQSAHQDAAIPEATDGSNARYCVHHILGRDMRTRLRGLLRHREPYGRCGAHSLQPYSGDQS